MEQDGLEAPFASPTYSPQPSRSRGKNMKRVIIVIIIFILVGAIGIGATRFIPAEKKAPVVKITPTPTDVFPTDTPTPEVSPSVKPSPASATANPVDKATGLDRSSLTVIVQNGSGAVGVASKASDVLKGFGYHVTSLENASNFEFQQTEILVKSAKAKYLPLLKKDLSGTYSIGSTSATLSASSSADAVVIIGKE